MGDPFFQLWFAVRYVHVASVAVLAGGAAVLCALSLQAASVSESDAALLAAPLYEWMFWAMAGITVVTGISNLGLKGDGLMGPATSWGRALTIKLSAALLLLVLSVVRSHFVMRCGERGSAAAAPRVRQVLGSLYGLTVAMLLGALWLGLGLAHGRY